MEMPVSHSIHTEVQKESFIRKNKGKCTGNIKKLCKYKNVEIIEGAVCADHVYLCVNIPSKLSVSEFMGYLKGKSALMIYDVHPDQGSKWNRTFWARGYYVAIVGNITEEAMKRYIQEQQEESKKKK